MARKSNAVAVKAVKDNGRISGTDTFKTTDHLSGDQWTARKVIVVQYLTSLPAEERAILHKIATVVHNSGINRKIFTDAISEDYKVLNPASVTPADKKNATVTGKFVTPEMMEANNTRLLAEFAKLLKK